MAKLTRKELFAKAKKVGAKVSITMKNVDLEEAIKKAEDKPEKKSPASSRGEGGFRYR